MTDRGDSQSDTKKIPRFVLHKDQLRNITVIKPRSDGFFKSVKTYSRSLYKEDLIYESVPGDFLRLCDEKLTIVNRLNLVTKSCLTVAKYTRSGQVTDEKTSENISNLIGKENYDLLFSTLCSVISNEFKIRGILALLTVPKKTKESPCQVSDNVSVSEPKVFFESSSQTEETSFDIMMKTQPRRRVKRQFPTPYVVTDKPNKLTKVVINPSDFKNFSFPDLQLNTVKTESTENTTERVKTNIASQSSSTVNDGQTHTEIVSSFPDLNINMDEDSKDSIGGLSQISFMTSPELLKDPLSLISNIDKVTERVEPAVPADNATTIRLLDGTVIPLPVKVEDEFHIACPEVLRHVPREYWRKLLLYQVYMDWKLCLRRDEDNHLPIHTAVLNGDVDLVRRQCLMLKSREESVDILTGDNASALQLSILGGTPLCTSLLLQQGADPLFVDEEYRSCFHLAAEAAPENLRALLNHCRSQPQQILQDSEELWKPELALKPKEYQASYLLNKVCSLTDNPGYTPLMLAAKLGRDENVRLLLDAAPSTVNAAMPTGGNTALHLAVESACHDSANRGNTSKISDNFRKTIELLVENGADPTISNGSDVDVNAVLADFNNSELSQVIASRLTYINTRDTPSRAFEPLMLIKKEDGTYNTENISVKSKGNVSKIKNTRIIKNVKNTSKVIKNTGKVIKNTGKVIKNTIKVDNAVPSTVKVETQKSKKLIIIDNKIIKPVKKDASIDSNKPKQYLNSYEHFVKSFENSKNGNEGRIVGTMPSNVISNTLKRKSDAATPSPVKLVYHPRVKCLSTSSSNSKESENLVIDTNSNSFNILSNVESPSRDTQGKIYIVDKPSSSKLV